MPSVLGVLPADYSVAVGSKRICKVRAKIIKGSAGIIPTLFSLTVLTTAVPGQVEILEPSLLQCFAAVPGRAVEILVVICSRKIAYGFQGTLGSRAKVGMGFVMLVGSRKIVYRYAGIYIGCSVDHHELLFYI